ncbi:MAG TPA: hypothetical protein VFX20_11845 [Steroidobacteraceae bacterium]|nr:hypothetical protein [Steroidobacteraceae bacterium]
MRETAHAHPQVCGTLRLREAGISNSELARRMQLDEKEARRILDPHHPTRLPRIEAALAVLGRHVELSLA